jgi:hypothetical protein
MRDMSNIHDQNEKRERECYLVSSTYSTVVVADALGPVENVARVLRLRRAHRLHHGPRAVHRRPCARTKLASLRTQTRTSCQARGAGEWTDRDRITWPDRVHDVVERLVGVDEHERRPRLLGAVGRDEVVEHPG